MWVFDRPRPAAWQCMPEPCRRLAAEGLRRSAPLRRTARDHRAAPGTPFRALREGEGKGEGEGRHRAPCVHPFVHMGLVLPHHRLSPAMSSHSFASLTRIARFLFPFLRSSKSSDLLFTSAASTCLPLLRAAVEAAVAGTISTGFFLNVNVPADPLASKVGLPASNAVRRRSSLPLQVFRPCLARPTPHSSSILKPSVALPRPSPPSPPPLPPSLRASGSPSSAMCASSCRGSASPVAAPVTSWQPDSLRRTSPPPPLPPLPPPPLLPSRLSFPP